MWHTSQANVSVMFLPQFGIICDLLLNIRTTTRNVSVLYSKKPVLHTITDEREMYAVNKPYLLDYLVGIL